MNKTFIKLHVSILLAGFTGLFGKLISLNEGLLVWYRMLLAALILFFYMLLTRRLQKVKLYDFGRIARVGAILALHWLFFYGSIKASNVSIGVICFSLTGFFTAILEPLILRQKFSGRQLAYSLIALLGVFLIFSFDIRYRTGIILGIISAALASLFTIMTKRISLNYPPYTILLYEMIGGAAFISLLLPVYLLLFPAGTILPDAQDLIWLCLFVVFCTIVLQHLQIVVLRKISAFTVSLSYNLEPIYSIVLAMLLLGEAKELNCSFYAGTALIILSVLLQIRDSLRKRPETLAGSGR